MDIASCISWIWVGVFAVLLAIEVATRGLTTIWGAVSAFVMVFISRTGMGIGWQLLLFLSITLVLLFMTRPVAVKKLKVGETKTNVETMIGDEVLVTKAIGRFEKGEARSRNGVIWSATGIGGSEIEKGAVCTVKSVEGNTLTVEKE